jgi:hypothetical protein
VGQRLFTGNYSDLNQSSVIVLPNAGYPAGMYFAVIRDHTGQHILKLQKD